jgi:pyrrolidone-carboxylate peptidase
MRKILIYSFKHSRLRNISSDVLKKLLRINSFTIDCTNNTTGQNDTDRLLKHINKTAYQYIIGLGTYSPKKDLLKLEKVAKNKFRNNVIIYDAPQTYKIGEFLNKRSGKNSIIESTKMGNSWCNMTAYVIRYKLNSSALNGFIHIPNNPKNVIKYSTLLQDIIDDILPTLKSEVFL